MTTASHKAERLHQPTATVRDQRTPKPQRLVPASHTNMQRLASTHTKTQRFGDAPSRGRPSRTVDMLHIGYLFGYGYCLPPYGTSYRSAIRSTRTPTNYPYPNYRCQIGRVANGERRAQHLAYRFGFGVWVLGFQVSGLGFRVSGFGFGF